MYKTLHRGSGFQNVTINNENVFEFTALKLQKTLPTEGYHIWHLEHSPMQMDSNRAFVFSIYLNDVEEGGETEFLHFSKRVKPTTGRIVIWPAAFPYLHRGNPPLSGEKYILTSSLKVTNSYICHKAKYRISIKMLLFIAKPTA